MKLKDFFIAIGLGILAVLIAFGIMMVTEEEIYTPVNPDNQPPFHSQD